VTGRERQTRSAPRIDLKERLALPGSLLWRTHALGGVVLVAYAVLTALSYVQAAALWRHEAAPRTQAFFDALSAQLQPFAPAAAAWFGGGHPFGTPLAVVVTYWAGLGVASAAVLALMVSLLRRPQATGSGLPRVLLLWSYAFAGVCGLAFPVFTQDLWLSAAWGRMIAAGINPFYVLFTPESLANLPLDHFPMPMSYGPLWGLLSAGLMLVAGGSVLLAGILFKVLIGIAWIGALHLVSRLTLHQPPHQRCMAILVFGWMPAGVSQTLAEGHNDIAMVGLALLWLYWLMHGRSQAPLALAASVLCKYVTAPLFVVDALWALRRERVGWRRYILRMTAPAIFVLATMAVFYRSPEFFDGLRLVSTWFFLQPRDAVQAIEFMIGVPLWPLELAATAAFPLYAAYAAWTAWHEPTTERLLQTALAVMSAVLFSAVSHLWAWYLVWTLALAVLVPTWWLARFIIGVSLLSPFTLGFWWIEPLSNHHDLVALIMYASAIGWTLLARPQPVVVPLQVAEHA
jgi:alpha-1,6-mannosyltransferase